MIPVLFTAEAAPEALIDVNYVPLQDVNYVELLASGDTSSARPFDNYGLGALTDCISCEITEERNGEYELVMEYPMTGVHFDEIENRCIIWEKPNDVDGPQAFRIYRISAPIDGVVTVEARHLIYDLSGVPVKPFTATSCAAACSGLMSNALVTNPFTIGTQIGTIADFEVDVPSSVRSWFGGKEGSLIDVYGGEWAYDNYTATLKSARGQDRGVVIRYGKNLIDFEQEKNCEEVWTGVLAYWQDQESGAVVRTNIINVAGSYDYRRILCLDMSTDFEEKPTVAQLTAKANTYITANNIGVPKVSITLDWAQTNEQVELCDTVTVEFEKLGVSAKAKVIRTVWDGLKERYSEIEIGDPKTNIADTIAGMQDEDKKLQTSVSAPMLRAIANATALITGNEGGYVVMHDGDGDGYPDELLIMDTPDIDTATKVWRWNKSGLGYSSSGYSGTFGLAMTSNGEIVADYITTGTLSAVDISGVNITGSTITGGTVTGSTITGGTVTGSTINNGSGTFQVDASGNMTASKVAITGGYITLDTENMSQGFTLQNTAGTTYTKMTASSLQRYSSGSLILSALGGSISGTGTCSFAQSYSSTVSTAANCVVTGGGTLYRSTSSSRRYKTDITDDLGELEPTALYDIGVVRFKFKDDYISEDDQRYGKDVIGFIAEDVAEKYPIAVQYDDEGKPEMWESNYMIPAMLKLIQDQKKEIDELRERLDRLEARFLDDRR